MKTNGSTRQSFSASKSDDKILEELLLKILNIINRKSHNDEDGDDEDDDESEDCDSNSNSNSDGEDNSSSRETEDKEEEDDREKDKTEDALVVVDKVELLQQAQKDLYHIMQLQTVLQKVVQSKQQQVHDLHFSISPFTVVALSPSVTEEVVIIKDKDDAVYVDGNPQLILRTIISYFDEYDLLQFEQAISDTKHMDHHYHYHCKEVLEQQWQILDTAKSYQSDVLSLDCTSYRQRMIRYTKASQFAKQMETAGKYQYDRRHYGNADVTAHLLQHGIVWPEELYTREIFYNDFHLYDSGDESPPTNIEFFVRISYDNPTTTTSSEDSGIDNNKQILLFEGFMGQYSDIDPWPSQDHYAIINTNKDNTHVHFVINDINALSLPTTTTTTTATATTTASNGGSGSSNNNGNSNATTNTMGIQINKNKWLLGKRSIEWPPEEQKAFMQRVSVTVVACKLVRTRTRPGTITEEDEEEEEDEESSSSEEGNERKSDDVDVDDGGASQQQQQQQYTFVPQLVTTTRGYKSSNGLLAIMPPRSTLAKTRTASILDCVNIGFKPTEEGGTRGGGEKGSNNNIDFRIMIDWGPQDIFTRRKSILDHLK